MLLTDWTADADALLPETVALRRAIHTEPEVGLHLPKTTARIKAELAGLPLEFREGPSTTGLIAVLKGAANGRTVLLRGDMDALPMTEHTGLDYASQTDGAMHACGHDAHVAMLVGAAKVLCAKRDRLAGTVLFMFQPGEEGWHGARHMLDDGLIDPLPDAAFALHMSPNMQAGVFAGRAGPLLASSDKLRITVNGRGGHASMPHDALDPIPVACAIVGAIQTYITRTISVFDPAVVTFGRIEAGSTDNVIPAEAKMWGTLRTLSERTRDTMHAGLKAIVEHTALAYGATAEIDIETGFPVTVCDSRAAALAQRTVQDVFGADAWATMPTPMMGAEDFAYVLQRAPGAMMFLGAAPVATGWHSCCGLHSNRMTIDDSVLARGVALHCALAERYLAEGFAE
ncbi:amidohydrolase [Polymorphobacter arshaanensis]|uniref:Amidohydrolase n=1 Tax=Glacieibacterium arshaanense TaxID=2511025 RepID=A0A4Y9EMN6_9SPHN|nr:M20 family metallopeptidase [Polymorphobacter arshaanensis]TFU03316.1 amidohydrolase [Polymorphobacter arshaanensis]